MRASRTRELTGEVDDEAVFVASGVNDRDQRMMPPGSMGVSECAIIREV